MSAVALLVTQTWDTLRGMPLLILALGFTSLGFGLTHYFLKKKLRIPAGIMATFTLALVPLIVYNAQFVLGYHPAVKIAAGELDSISNWYWLNMKIVTIAVGAMMFYFYRFTFLLFPLAIILWSMSLDVVPLFFPMQDDTLSTHATFSILFGLLILSVAIWLDFSSKDDGQDYAFWLYIFGVITFWSGLNVHIPNSELGKFFYCLVNVMLLFVGALLNRRIFAVVGAIGILMYIIHLAFEVFANSVGFPIAMVILGILIIFAAMYLRRIEMKIQSLVRPYIPAKLLKRLR